MGLIFGICVLFIFFLGIFLFVVLVGALALGFIIVAANCIQKILQFVRII